MAIDNYNTNNFMKQLKELIDSFYINGEIVEEIRGKLRNLKLLPRQAYLYRLLVDLLVNTEFIRVEAKYYIQKFYASYAETANHFRKLGKGVCNSDSIQSICYRAKCKILNSLGEDVIVAIGNPHKVNELHIYEKKILECLAIYGGGRILEGIKVKLPSVELSTTMSDEDFEGLMNKVMVYTEQQIKKVTTQLNPRDIGYLTLITSTSLLTDKDKERKDRVLEMLKPVEREEVHTDDDKNEIPVDEFIRQLQLS
ncbi:MAG TPA: hypothetical protein DCP90_08470 [Clostridiales bacterium]|nr:MAG: hypothetical protein A2Y22_08290 [Clostridiales bacterium GWD2_32_59]HAN10627.1 hypothetical protein [Clostridiales bacterium]